MGNLTDFQIGLVVSAVGLGVTFTALLIFIGVIVLLQKLFPPKTEIEGTDEAVVVNVIATDQSQSDEALAVAVATAAYMRSRRSGQLGSSLLAGPGPYWTSR
ncbi:MAG: OadG-related small transporter subunit [Chloroflexi bacterium]|nr:OadG-related small transporter subunit [Chloroflexota bacterium]